MTTTVIGLLETMMYEHDHAASASEQCAPYVAEHSTMLGEIAAQVKAIDGKVGMLLDQLVRLNDRVGKTEDRVSALQAKVAAGEMFSTFTTKDAVDLRTNLSMLNDMTNSLRVWRAEVEGKGEGAWKVGTMAWAVVGLLLTVIGALLARYALN